MNIDMKNREKKAVDIEKTMNEDHTEFMSTNSDIILTAYAYIQPHMYFNI